MRKFLLAIILAVATTTGALAQTPAPTPAATDIPAPAHPATAAQIKEYFTLTNSVVNARKLMGQMVTGMQSTSAPYYPAAFWDDMRSSVDAIDLEAAFIPAYQRYFSQEDMAQVLIFYRSSAGKRLLEAQPSITADAQQVLRAAGEKIGQEVYLRHKAEIEAATQKNAAEPNSSPKE